MLKVLHKCLLIECNQIAELRQTGALQPVHPSPGLYSGNGESP